MEFLKHKHEYPSHINTVWFFEAVIRTVSIMRAFKLKYMDYYNHVQDYMRNIKLSLPRTERYRYRFMILIVALIFFHLRFL